MNVLSKVTLKSLIKNKTRTIVTVIGVILSTAMITAVFTAIFSFQQFLVNTEIKEYGSWHTKVNDIPLSKADSVLQNPKVKDGGIFQVQGYAQLPDFQNESKPYLYISSWSRDCFDLLPVKLEDGRLPLNEEEIIIPEHVASNGGVIYKLGDKINLQVGTRVQSDGAVLTQSAPFTSPESGTTESLKNTVLKSYTVVGFFERPEFEGYSTAGYTVIAGLTTSSIKSDGKVSLYYSLKNPKDTYSLAKTEFGKNYIYEMHTDLLRFQGASDNNEVNNLLYGMGSVLIVLIMLGSISLIYNSFSISVSERSKQFGMLSGSGATSKQIRRMVITEAFYISLIGIPLGVLSGLGGIGITLLALKDMFASASPIGSYPTLIICLPIIALSVLVGLATILISAYIPARRASKMSAIEAIRSTKDVRIKPKQLKTSRLVRRLFGMEGDLAVKNFKRNRRRYRSTVISLFLSIVLFVAASSFTMYMSDSVDTVFDETSYDIMYSADSSTKTDKILGFYNAAKPLENVSGIAMLKTSCVTTTTLDGTLITDTAKEKAENYNKLTGKLDASLDIIILDDESFKGYCKELGLNDAEYLDKSNPRAIAYDKQTIFKGKKYANYSLLKSHTPTKVDLNTYSESTQKYEKTVSDFPINFFADKPPLGASSNSSSIGSFALFISETASQSQTLHELLPFYNKPRVAFRSDDPSKLYVKLETLLKEKHMSYSNLYNVYASVESTRNILTIVNVFSYGFIVLISLIATANVFNTISTNVNLRRREFAMLKSIGMTKRGFNKMMNFECIFYGLKSILYGLPVSILFTYLMFKSVSKGVVVAFYLPWNSIVTAILSVFAVVFATMLYSMSKIRKENIIDALKNENL